MRADITDIRHVMAIALRARRNLGYKLTDAFCIFDAAEKLEIETMFVEIPSMEGMYSRNKPPHILISSMRPRGRQSFTCAHEIGHHYLGSGAYIDETVLDEWPNPSTPEEFLADCFAGFFLMPKVTVEYALKIRGWKAQSLQALQVYSIACWMGVSYAALVNQMSRTLGILSAYQAEKLAGIKLKQIKHSLLADSKDEDIIIVDQNWINRPVDIRVGDFIFLPYGTRHEGKAIVTVAEEKIGLLVRGEVPGISRAWLENNKWSSYIRVSRKGYSGLGKFRHLEEVKDE